MIKSRMKLDIHIHSSYSDGVNTPQEIIDYAKSIGLDGLAITDHDSVEGSLIALEYDSKDFRVIPGLEVSSLDGHILALGVTELIKRDLSAEKTIKEIHELGGIAIAAHPYDRFRLGVGDLIYSLDFDAVEVFNGRALSSSRNMKKIAEDIKLPITGGSDAHSMDEVGGVCIIVGNDPLDSIKRGDVEVEVNTSKMKLLRSYLKTGLRRFIG
jgi:predicted metal-dependent phosphoesterase TrpH